MSEHLRRQRFERILDQLEELLEKTDDPMAHRATAVALLHHKIPRVSWTGFYLLTEAGDLVVDVYQGPLACLVLARHTGVCWAALDRRQTLVVDDVRAFPGHIACDDRTRSELVVPVHNAAGAPIGVLDIDSHEADRFDAVEQQGYEAVVRMLERRWWGDGSSRL